MLYLLSDFRALWQAMQFCTKIGATSFMKLTGACAASALAGSASAFGASSPRLVARAASATIAAAEIERMRGIGRNSEEGEGASLNILVGRVQHANREPGEI